MSNQYLDTVPEIALPQEVLREKERLTAFGDSTIFGSYMYRFQKYPGDVDIVEKVEGSNLETLISSFIKALKRIVSNILSSRQTRYIEAKCGYDSRYDIKIGEIENGRYMVDGQLRTKIKELYQQQLLENDDYDDLMLILNYGNLLNADSFDTVMKIMRKYYILRWTSSEIMNEVKELPNGKILSLHDALTHKTMVKLDEITFINGKLTEITNVYGLSYDNRDGGFTEIYPISDANVLTVDIEKLYYSNMYYSPFKMIKRMYSYCRFKNTEFQSSGYESNNDRYMGIIQKIVPILKSTLSLFYQLISEYKTILSFIEHGGNSKEVNKQLDGSKMKLNYVLNLSNDDIIHYSKMINNIIRSNDKVSLLEELIDDLMLKLNSETIKSLMCINLNPPPEITLPNLLTTERFIPDENFLTNKNAKTYNRLIIRKPEDNPYKEYDSFIESLKPLPPAQGDMEADLRAREMILRQIPFDPYN